MKTTETPILVVDDEPLVLRFICQCLRQEGYAVLEAASGADAIELCRTNKGPISLGLFDVIMPGICGRDLKHSLEQLYPDLRVLYMSGLPEMEFNHEFNHHDMEHFIAKPFTCRDLLARVQGMLTEDPEPGGHEMGECLPDSQVLGQHYVLGAR